jgi:hypothetical protein
MGILIINSLVCLSEPIRLHEWDFWESYQYLDVVEDDLRRAECYVIK